MEEQLGRFISGNRALKAQYLERLKAMHASLASCALFSDHQFINTSLLFVHDVSAPRRAPPLPPSRCRPSSAPAPLPLTRVRPLTLGFTCGATAGAAAALRRLDDRL